MTLTRIVELVNTKFDSVPVLQEVYNELSDNNIGRARAIIRDYLKLIGEWVD
jgi:hypothetical protein